MSLPVLDIGASCEVSLQDWAVYLDAMETFLDKQTAAQTKYHLAGVHHNVKTVIDKMYKPVLYLQMYCNFCDAVDDEDAYVKAYCKLVDLYMSYQDEHHSTSLHDMCELVITKCQYVPQVVGYAFKLLYKLVKEDKCDSIYYVEELVNLLTAFAHTDHSPIKRHVIIMTAKLGLHEGLTCNMSAETKVKFAALERCSIK